MNDTQAAWDGLFVLYLAVGLASGAVIYGWIAFAVLRYRERPTDEGADKPVPVLAAEEEHGSARAAGLLTLVVTVVLFSLTLQGLGAFQVLHEPPGDPETLYITVVGFQYGWKFEYPNGNTSVTQLFVPLGRVVDLKVTSKDDMHSFGIPDFRIKTDAIPGQMNEIWFRADTEGVHAVHCMELCGPGHSAMHGEVVVLPADAFDAWAASYPAP